MAAVFEMTVTCASKGGGNAVNFRSPDRTVITNPDGQIVITGLAQARFDALKVGTNYKMEVSTLVAVSDEPVVNTGSFEEVKKQESSVDRIEALRRQQQSQVQPPNPYRR